VSTTIVSAACSVRQIHKEPGFCPKKLTSNLPKTIVLPAEIFPSARCSEDKLDELLAEKKTLGILAWSQRPFDTGPVDFLEEYIFAKKCFLQVIVLEGSLSRILIKTSKSSFHAVYIRRKS